MSYESFSRLFKRSILVLNICSISLLSFIQSNAQSSAQTSLDMDEFNSAYLQYTDTKDSEPTVAREAARRAYDLGRQLFGLNSERSAMLAINYATLIGDEAASQALLDEAVEIYQSVFGFGSEAMIGPLERLGATLYAQGRSAVAIQYYSRALQLAQTHLGESSTKVGSIELELAAILLRSGELDQSWERLTRAKAILSNHSDAGSQSGLTRIDLLTGEHLLAQGQYAAAIEPLLTSLDKFKRYPNANVTQRNRIALIRAYQNLSDQNSIVEHCRALSADHRQNEAACNAQ